VLVTTAIPLYNLAAIGKIDTSEGQPIVTATGRMAFRLLALDTTTGRIVWSRTVTEAIPHESAHTDGSWASNSPITDGERIYVYFGSRGLHCFDLDGNPIWRRSLGDKHTLLGFGEGSSPLLVDGQLFVIWDHEDDSFLVALDAATGEELWRAARDEATSWTTPIFADGMIVTTAAGGVRAYDPTTGALNWSSAETPLNSIVSPIAHAGLLFAVSSFEAGTLLALRTSDAELAWSRSISTPYVSTPLSMDGMLYVVKDDQGVVYGIDATTGELHYGPQRLSGVRGLYASPVGADGRVYFAGRRGATAVINAGPDFELLAVNHLDDGFTASPAIVGNAIYLRGDRFLYCLAETP
jgi:outer membrane protein assembly factor BamB